MNMLAMQNIGQAFSENPVEALSILKQDSKGSNNIDSHSNNRQVIRRNSNASRVGTAADSNNQSFIKGSSINN